jgi:excisionase family DNA binding protein
MAIRNLETHPSRYVSVHELMEYWGLSRYQLYKQIEAGTLRAVRLGPRLYRIHASEALRFQRAANLVGNGDYVRPHGGV